MVAASISSCPKSGSKRKLSASLVRERRHRPRTAVTTGACAMATLALSRAGTSSPRPALSSTTSSCSWLFIWLMSSGTRQARLTVGAPQLTPKVLLSLRSELRTQWVSLSAEFALRSMPYFGSKLWSVHNLCALCASVDTAACQPQHGWETRAPVAPMRVWMAAVMGRHGLVPNRSQNGRVRRRQGREKKFRILSELEMEPAFRGKV